MYVRQLLLEASIVAISSALAFYIAVKVRPLRSSTDVLFAGALVGLILHLGYEFFGLNKTYCSMGAACMQ